jgi:diguanylate cyclase (GGDEF)-like protein
MHQVNIRLGDAIVVQRLFRSIQAKTILALVGMFLLLMTIIIVVMNTLMMNSIEELEYHYISERMNQISIGISVELNDLKKTAVDWAEWNDPYQFVADGNQGFIDENLGTNTFENLRLDSIVYMNNSGEIVYARQINEAAAVLEPVPDVVKERFKILIGSNLDAGKRLQGILNTPAGAMLFATNPILTSTGGGPVNGNIVIYRYLNGKEIAYLSTVIGQEIFLEENIAQSAQEFVAEYTNIVSGISVRTISAETIKGLATFYDIDQNPAVTVSLDMNRDMNMIGSSGIRSVLIAMFFTGLIFTLLIIFFTNKMILSRLLSMSRTIKDIGEHDNPAKRLKPDGYCDELSAMKGEINSMLDKLQISRQQIIEREGELKQTAKELLQEVSERKKAQEQITHLAYHDHLTGLPNRIHFSEDLNHGIRLAKRTGKLLGVMFLDLDGFKMINDSMGHLSGDLLLVEASRRLKAILRESDTVARLGGDEFVVMAENISDVSDIKKIAQAILDSFCEPFILNNQECLITTSIGVAVYPADGEDSETLIKNADIAMYRAKEKGKNQYVICSDGIKNKVLQTIEISNHLFHALDRGEFEVYYQPQVSCSTNLIVGAEALIRWHHPIRGMVLPGEFISIAEQTGQILPIGAWVLRTACTQNKIWQDAGYPRIRISVNLSIRQFQNYNIVGEVKSVLSDTGFDPTYLELEITESIAMREQGYIVESLNMLRKLGIHITIDDFGTEYSSMNHLKKLPVDRIKIPMPFVQGIGKGSKDKAITKSIIVLAKSLGLGVTAEGVETKEQHDFLTQRMCDEIQGFYHFRPMPSADFEKLLALQQNRQAAE